MIDNVNIQYQTSVGNWITVNCVLNTPITIINAMKAVASMYNGSRVRAVDENGRVVDILT